MSNNTTTTKKLWNNSLKYKQKKSVFDNESFGFLKLQLTSAWSASKSSLLIKETKAAHRTDDVLTLTIRALYE